MRIERVIREGFSGGTRRRTDPNEAKRPLIRLHGDSVWAIGGNHEEHLLRTHDVSDLDEPLHHDTVGGGANLMLVEPQPSGCQPGLGFRNGRNGASRFASSGPQGAKQNRCGVAGSTRTSDRQLGRLEVRPWGDSVSDERSGSRAICLGDGEFCLRSFQGEHGFSEVDRAQAREQRARMRGARLGFRKRSTRLAVVELD